MRTQLRALCVLAIAAIAAFAIPSCAIAGDGSSTPLIAIGLDYQIPDTPVIVSVRPTAKGGYDLDVRVTEGEITDWLEVLPDGSYLVTAGDGTQLRIIQADDGRIFVTIVSTGEHVRLVPIE